MNLETYLGLAVRTRKHMGTKELDSFHMTGGMNSETNELLEAIDLYDKVNIGEEIADKFWYAANLIDIHKMDLTLFDDKYKSGQVDFNTLFKRIVNIESKLIDIDKKVFIYNKEETKQMQEERVFLTVKYVYYLNSLFKFYDIDRNEYLQKNIDKLIERYPGKYEDYLANNRNLDKEREILEA